MSFKKTDWGINVIGPQGVNAENDVAFGVTEDNKVALKLGNRIITEDGGSGIGIVIKTEETTTVDGWDVPDLTTDQIKEACDAIKEGKNIVVTDNDEEVHYIVTTSDLTTGRPSIVIPYYWLGYVNYQVTEDDDVQLTAHKFN